MNIKTTLLIALTATLLGCSSTEQVEQQAAATTEKVAVAETVEPSEAAGSPVRAAAKTDASGQAATDSRKRRPVLIGRIETKPMNITSEGDRLFQNGPTAAEIKRFRARQKKRNRGTRLSAERGGHSMPKFADQVETISEKG